MAFKDVYQVLELANRESAAREQSPERDTPTLTPIDRLVWVALAHHKHHNTGLCCPGYERLMRVTGLGRTALSASLQRLKNDGRISVERHGRASRYSWEFPELPEALPEDEVREANFSSSRNELQKAAKRISEVRETASNRVLKTGKERREGEASTVTVPNGQRSTVAAMTTSLRDETTTTPRGDPDKTTTTATTTTAATTSGEHSPDPSATKWIPRDKEVDDLVETWTHHSSKPCFRKDFVNLLIGLKDTDISWCHVEQAMIWMFTTSQWASESPNWAGPFDIRSSGDFVNFKNFPVMYDQCGDYYTKQQAGLEEQREREAQKV